MKVRKTYYSIGEVSKILNIKEHTLRFWDSQLPGLSKESDKGKTRFFTENNINKIAEINKLLNNNNALNLAYRIVSNNKSDTSKKNLNICSKVNERIAFNQDEIKKIRSVNQFTKKFSSTLRSSIDEKFKIKYLD